MTEQVEHEHQVISAALDATSAACATWRERPSAATGEALAAALDHLNAVVQPHLDDEEQKVVPLAAVTLTQQEWDAMGRAGMSKVPRNKRGIAAGMMPGRARRGRARLPADDRPGSVALAQAVPGRASVEEVRGHAAHRDLSAAHRPSR